MFWASWVTWGPWEQLFLRASQLMAGMLMFCLCQDVCAMTAHALITRMIIH